MILMPFKDSVTLYESEVNEYGKEVASVAHTSDGAFEQVTDYTHGQNQDGRTSASRLYLPDSSYLQGINYRLEGKLCTVNGVAYKINEAFPVRDTLLGNKVTHIECDLKVVTNQAIVS